MQNDRGAINLSMQLQGVLDMHVHAAPDIRPRKMDVIELARAAEAAGMRGFLFKNHSIPTVGQVDLLHNTFPKLKIFGGLALNDAVGGLNPHAVDVALKMGAAEIWMPTHSAQHERSYRLDSRVGLTVLDADGRVKPEVVNILTLIASKDAILGLGHLSTNEMLSIVKTGKELGITKILVNHPEINFLNLSLDFQRELLTYGVYFERCYVRANSAVDWDGLAFNIRTIGVESTILATDLGQPDNPDPVSGMQEMLDKLSKCGFTDRELELMSCKNPAMLLNLN
jgi:hypothetical protein